MYTYRSLLVVSWKWHSHIGATFVYWFKLWLNRHIINGCSTFFLTVQLCFWKVLFLLLLLLYVIKIQIHSCYNQNDGFYCNSNVNKCSVCKNTNTELDFKNEKLFHTCSVATNLVMSLEILPIRYSITLCHFGQTRSGSIATHFNLLNSIATSSAAGRYIIIPESFGQNEEAVAGNDERIKKKPFAPKPMFKWCNQIACKFLHVFMSLSILFFSFFDVFIILIILWKIFWSFVCTNN